MQKAKQSNDSMDAIIDTLNKLSAGVIEGKEAAKILTEECHVSEQDLKEMLDQVQTVKTSGRTEAEHAEQMNRLAERVGMALNDEPIGDGIMACAACLAWGLSRLPEGARKNMRDQVDKFITHNIEHMSSE